MNKHDDDNYDPAHEADMRELMREQLRADISPEEAAEECPDWDDYDPEQCDFEEDWEDYPDEGD